MGNGIIKYLIDSVLDVIYFREEACILCNSTEVYDNLLCNECIKTIDFCSEGFKLRKYDIELQCYSAVYYKGAVKELVQRLKYKSDFSCGEVLGDFIVKLFEKNNINCDLITFVPMHSKALKKRGFNQSEFLAKHIGSSVNKPIVQCIKKIKNTKDQIGLDAISRFENLEDCFTVINSKIIRNKNIILVDDVVTTGATAIHCSKELLNCGAAQVTILTAAKSSI